VIKLSIIIPCYNESESVEILVNKCKQIQDSDIEIILVDNGSTDNTHETLTNLNVSKQINSIRIDKNIGYGNGILKGLEKAKGNIVSWTHADLQTDIFDVIKAFKIYEKELTNQLCLVKGERKKRNFLDAFFTFSMGLYCSIVLRKWFYDINAQPKVFHRKFLKKFKNPPKDFSLDLFVLHFFKTNKIKIRSFPVSFDKRKFGEAKGGGTFRGKLKLIKRTLIYVNKLNKEVNGTYNS
jgi:glycosyltransferase involved in cell wall biosynthesis